MKTVKLGHVARSILVELIKTINMKKNEMHKDIPLSNWYSEGILIAKPEAAIQRKDADDYSDVNISSESHD